MSVAGNTYDLRRIVLHPLASTAVSAIVTVSLAVLYLALNQWFGVSDITGFVFWTLLLCFLLFFALIAFHRVTASWATWARYATAVPISLGVGIGYYLIPSFCLGPWILAFSLPVGALWLVAAVVAFMTSIALAAPKTALVALALAIAVPALVLYPAYRLSIPPPGLVIVMRSNATREEINNVWNHGLGTTTSRGVYYPEGVSSVSSDTYEGKPAIRVEFQPGTTQSQIDSITVLVQSLPGVLKVVRSE